MKKSKYTLSNEGYLLLADPLVSSKLKEIAEEVGVSAEEHLARFEEVLFENPEKIMFIFEENLKSSASRVIL